MYEQIELVKSRIDMSLKVIRMYDWLIDMYVLDFFVDNHWDKLPESWKESFQNVDPEKLGSIILSDNPTSHVYPLSFLALLKTVKCLCINRKRCAPRATMSESCEFRTHPKLKNLLLKHVKLKKRHEIDLMAEVVRDTAIKSGCQAVIDFGSGLGHLVRVLSYKYNLYAAGIESQPEFIETARKLDLELEHTAAKHLTTNAMSELNRPLHFNMTLTSQKQMNDLPLPGTMRNYGLIGLHPCGDLGPLLLKHFVDNDKVKFICLVGCCFMKLTQEGYPMSEYVKRRNSHLSYVSREISCHAIESYCERLIKGKYEDLKIHTYRAALESIFVEIDPKLKHMGIRNIKLTNDMSFERYCSLALEQMSLPFPFPCWAQVASASAARVAQWRRVLTLYTLRLALAPLVESLILLDRHLFALENGINCEILPVFDPTLSPRNHIMIARR